MGPRRRVPRSNKKNLFLEATTLYDQSKYAEAEQLFGKALQERKERLGSKHSETLSSEHWLARTRFMQMKYGEAEVSFRLSLEGRKTTLQKDHQDTLLSKHWLARTLHELKRYPEAEELFEETLQAQERTLRKGHDDILWSRHRLAKTRFELKKYSEAEEAFQQMLNLGEEKRGPKHRDIRWKLARTLFELEKYTEAEQLFDQALRERKETPGINQSDILSSEHWLARTWFMQKKYGEAEASFRHSLEGQKTTLLDEHPNTLLSKYWLARTLYELERYPEAANLFLEVEGRGQAPGHEGQDTCSSTQWLMKIRNQHLQVSLSSRSQPDEAVSSYTQIASRHTPMRDQTQPAPQEQPNAVVSAGPPTSSSNTGSVSVLELPHHSKSRPSSYSEREYLALRPKVAFSSRSLFEPAPMGITMDSNGKKEYNTSWWRAFEQTSSYMEKLRRGLPEEQNLHPRRVKVAILDTGIDREDPLFRKARDHLPDGANIDFKDFVGNSQTPVDSSGHGTRVAYFLLQTTQNIDLWIARVFEYDEGTADSPERVKKEAIEKNVDIISISLGFEKDIEAIWKALMDAYSKGILIFAAASNDRHYSIDFQISFPARLNHAVFCINAHPSAQGKEWSTFNPRTFDGRDNFCIIGEDLRGPGPVRHDENGVRIETVEIFEGTSYATPIAAGVAALMLEYCRLSVVVEDQRGTKREPECLRKYEHMRAVFKRMCGSGYQRARPNMLMPWQVLRDRGEGHPTPWTSIDAAMQDKDH